MDTRIKIFKPDGPFRFLAQINDFVGITLCAI
jgi:hypothetical protein